MNINCRILLDHLLLFIFSLPGDKLKIYSCRLRLDMCLFLGPINATQYGAGNIKRRLEILPRLAEFKLLTRHGTHVFLLIRLAARL